MNVRPATVNACAPVEEDKSIAANGSETTRDTVIVGVIPLL